MTFLKNNKKAFTLWLKVPKVTAYEQSVLRVQWCNVDTPSMLLSNLNKECGNDEM